MGYESLSTVVVLVIIGIVMAVWLPKKTINSMKQVVKHRSDRYSSSLHLVDEQSGTRFSDVRTPQVKGAIMPTSQTDYARNREYIAHVRELRRAAARRRKWLAGGLLAGTVVVLVLALLLHFSPLYTLIPAALLAIVCVLGAQASKQARAWEEKIAAKGLAHKRVTQKRAQRVLQQQTATQSASSASSTVQEVQEEPRTDVLEQREIRRALHQGKIEQMQALARRKAQEEASTSTSHTDKADVAITEEQSDNHEHTQLVVRDQETAYLLDQTDELSKVVPASTIDAFDMAVNQDLISFSLGTPRNGVEPEAEEVLSLEIKSTRQVAKAEPPKETMSAESSEDTAEVVNDEEETTQTAPSTHAAVNDSIAFHESEAAATVEAPDETSDSLGSSLESILARRGN